MSYPDLGNWNLKQPNEIEPEAVAIAEALAWSAIDTLTAGRVAYAPITVRPLLVETDGTILLERPVASVVQVRQGGVVFADWRWDEPNILVNLDPDGWTANDDLTLPASDSTVLEVDYFNGFRPGKLLVWAAAELASEFYLAASGSKRCRLPSNVTAITRQGVSFEMSSPLFGNGRTGIHEIDIVLQRYNPYGVRTGAVLATPESIAQRPRVLRG